MKKDREKMREKEREKRRGIAEGREGAGRKDKLMRERDITDVFFLFFLLDLTMFVFFLQDISNDMDNKQQQNTRFEKNICYPYIRISCMNLVIIKRNPLHIGSKKGCDV